MPPKKKSDARTGRSDSQSRLAKGGAAHGQQLCGSCNTDVGECCIGCDACETWVHGTEMCSGLPQDVLTAILNYDGSGIKFICTKCRLEKPQSKTSASSGADKEIRETLQQLFQQFRGMCTVISELSSQVKALAQGNSKTSQPDIPATQHTTPVPSPAPAPVPDRTLIREELREMREREKRRQSIIIKGLTAAGPREAGCKFDQLTESQFGMKIDLAEIMQIPGHSTMFRAKIISDEQRKLILENAKKLKGSIYSSVYISRDLTRAQRTELFEKRKARLTSASTAPKVTGADSILGSQAVPSAPPLQQEN